jgi:hypothetical protein
LCPRAYLRVPNHGDSHLLPCCGYLPWRSRGLNTDSWRPPWGHQHDHWENSKDIHRLDQRTRRRDELVACKSTTRRVLASTFNLLNAIEIHDGFNPDAASRRNLKESTSVLSPKKASSPKQIPVQKATREFQDQFAWSTRKAYTCCDYSSPGCTGSTSASPSAASTCLPDTAALHQFRRASRLLVTRPHILYVNLAVRHEYSSSCRSGSTSTTPHAAATSSSGRTTTSTTYLD